MLYAFKGGSDGDEPIAGLIMDGPGNLYGTTNHRGTGCGRDGCGIIFKVAPNGAETLLYTFQGTPNDGAHGGGGVIMDKAGNLYGTTALGGSTDTCTNKGPVGCGTIFKLAPPYGQSNESVLYAFQGGNDGAGPAARLITDTAGNLYGTTGIGGGSRNCGLGAIGCGTVFKLAPNGNSWTDSVL